MMPATPMKSLHELGQDLLTRAHEASSGRASTMINEDHHSLKQLVLALRAGSALSEHENPGQATLQLLSGTAVVSTTETAWRGSAGDYLVIPDRTHDLRAISDAVVILTFVKDPHRPEPPTATDSRSSDEHRQN